MVQNRYPFSTAPANVKNGVLVVNPLRLDDLFKVGVISVRVQQFIENAGVAKVVLQIPAKKLLYSGQQVVKDGFVQVRLAHTAEELEYFSRLEESEIWEVTGENQCVLRVEGDKLVEVGNCQEISSFRQLWSDLSEKKKTGFVNKLPLFRADFLSVFWRSKKEALDMILERLRMRYEEKRSLEKVKPSLVVTPNLEHLRLLFDEKDPKYQAVYANAFLQTPDGYPPLIKFAKQSLGYQTQEQITGVELFMQLINIIGRESLPYTIYLIGGFGNVPYQTRDFFINIYPNLASNFVGISTPPKGFLKNEEMMQVIVNDINAKKPDLIFVGITPPTQEYFMYELMMRQVNYGVVFGVGRSIELVAGYQKKEPKIIERLHLSWAYRAIGNPVRVKRAVEDLKFAWKMLTK